MTLSRVRRFLEATTSVAVLLGAVVIIYVGLWSHFHEGAKPQLSVGLRTGATLHMPPNVGNGGATKTLIMAMNTACGYCQESVPFYRKLSEGWRKASESARLVAIFPNGEDDVKHFLRDNQLDVEASSSVDFGPLKITGTPTLILVGENGEIRDFWVGKLSADQEEQVIKSIAAPKAVVTLRAEK